MVARDFYELATKGHAAPAKGTTLNKAAEDYLAWFRQHRRAVAETEHVVKAHILPIFGDRRISDLTAPQIRAWLEKLGSSPARVRTGRKAKRQAQPGGAPHAGPEASTPGDGQSHSSIARRATDNSV